MAAGVSPISSRNTVPPSAASMRPIFWPAAPVKAPFSWPNSSLSSRDSLSAAQLMRVIAPLRPDISWMVEASTSLPTPVSPRMSTLAALVAKSRTWRGAPVTVGSKTRSGSPAGIDIDRSPWARPTSTNQNGPMRKPSSAASATGSPPWCRVPAAIVPLVEPRSCTVCGEPSRKTAWRRDRLR